MYKNINKNSILSPQAYYKLQSNCNKGKSPVSFQPSYFCCNLNCKGCNAQINKNCIKELKKKIYLNSGNFPPSIVKVQEQGANAYNKLVWLIQNLEYGYASPELDCNCNQFYTYNYDNINKKMHYKLKHCTNCNCNKGCNKLNKNYKKNCAKYVKVYNRFSDITYNTVDGWPPLGANNTSDFGYNPIKGAIPQYGQAPTQNFYDYIRYQRFINLQWIKSNNDLVTKKHNLKKFMNILYNKNIKNKDLEINKLIYKLFYKKN